jgi:threonine dehydrogenase-like Zn-dependent dehydrogenase
MALYHVSRYEVGAEIAEVGANVRRRCSGMPYVEHSQMRTVCSCRRRRYNAARHERGVPRNGAMREYLAVPWQKVRPVACLVCHQCPHRAMTWASMPWTVPRTRH